MTFGVHTASVNPFALDFAVGSLKAMQIAPGEKPTLIAASRLETPEELRSDPRAVLRFQLDSLPKFLKRAGFKGRRAICSLPATQTLVQHIQVQRTEGVPLKALIDAELQANMQIDPERIITRYIKVVDSLPGAGSRTEALCIAASRDVVLRQMQSLKSCRIEVVGVHSEHLALARAFDQITNREQDTNLTSLYLDIGVATTKVVIAHGRHVVFAKTIDVAGRNFDQAAAVQFGCTAALARARRLAEEAAGRKETLQTERVSQREQSASNGATAKAVKGASASTSADSNELTLYDAAASTVMTDDRRDGARSSMLSEEVARASTVRTTSGRYMTEPIEALTDEVSMCIRYHRRLFPERCVDRAFFVGGESTSVSLCQRIAMALRLPARIANPFGAIDKEGAVVHGFDVNESQPGWAVAFGLCHCPADY